MKFPFDQYPTLVVHISSRCNQKCRFCFKQDDFWGSEPITLNDLDALIKKGIAEYRVKGIWFGGGEPFLYDSLNKAVELVRQNKLQVLMTTNGLLLPDSQEFKKIIDKVDVLLVSLHSHIPEVHNHLVGNNDSFPQVMRTLSYLNENNKKFIINCVCTAGNYKLLPEFAEKVFGDFPSLMGLQILSLKYKGRLLDNKDIRVKLSRVAPYLKAMDSINRKKNLNIALRDFPLCLAPYDITVPRYPENYIGYVKNGKYIIDSIIAKDRVYPEKCRGCKLLTGCSGADVNYIKIEGAGELVPL